MDKLLDDAVTLLHITFNPVQKITSVKKTIDFQLHVHILLYR